MAAACRCCIAALQAQQLLGLQPSNPCQDQVALLFWGVPLRALPLSPPSTPGSHRLVSVRSPHQRTPCGPRPQPCPRSDVSKGRILLPRAAVEANLSFAIGKAHSLIARDHQQQTWEFTLQSWANGKGAEAADAQGTEPWQLAAGKTAGRMQVQSTPVVRPLIRACIRACAWLLLNPGVDIARVCLPCFRLACRHGVAARVCAGTCRRLCSCARAQA